MAQRQRIGSRVQRIQAHGSVANNFVPIAVDVSSPATIHHKIDCPDVALRLSEPVNMDINLKSLVNLICLWFVFFILVTKASVS
jgi:hypothetical protein